MSKRGDFEEGTTSAYRRKIWKYKMIVQNMNQPGSEALAYSANRNDELLDGLSKESILKLNE